MVLSTEEQKARRAAGMERAKTELPVAKRVMRDVTNGRPLISELKTPADAVKLAKSLLIKIEKGIAEETNGAGLMSHSFAVSIAHVSPDLSVLGFTPLLIGFSPAPYLQEEARIERVLAGDISFGLIFGIVNGDEILMGTRAFLVTKQTEAWLSALIPAVQSEFELERLERQ